MANGSGQQNTVGLIEFNHVPGIDVVQEAGLKILGIVFVAQLAYELYKMVRGDNPDLAGPIAKTGAGIILVQFVPELCGWLSSLSLGLANSIGSEAELALFGRAVSVALENTSCDETSWTAALGLLFSVKGWLLILSSVIFVFMYLAKFIVIDILYPVCFSLVVFLGLLSIPISLFPGSNGLRGWAKNVIEVALWPVVAQFLIAMLATTFPQALNSMADGQVSLDCGAGASIGLEQAVVPGATGLVAVLQYAAICCTYVLLILFTPMLSAMIMRGSPVGIVGGVIAAKAGGLLGSGVKHLAGAMGERIGKVGGAAGRALGGLASSIRSSGTREQTLNKR